MNASMQSVEQMVSAMASVLAKYLSAEEIAPLTVEWQKYPSVSVKMMQQCVLETTQRYPKIKEYKSDIRRGFWDTMQADAQLSTQTTFDKDRSIAEASRFEEVEAFYTVIEALRDQLNAPNSRRLLQMMHQTTLQERTFKGHSINFNQFLEGSRPSLPNDVYILNNLVQLAYVCLCDIVGPSDADDLLFQVAETAKQSHPKAVVEKLF